MLDRKDSALGNCLEFLCIARENRNVFLSQAFVFNCQFRNQENRSHCNQSQHTGDLSKQTLPLLFELLVRKESFTKVMCANFRMP